MNKIKLVLKKEMQGPEVSDLQEVLQLLLDRGMLLTNEEGVRLASAELKQEHAEQIFGEATRKLVGIFQGEQQLEVSGVVDESTAAALNQLLDELKETEKKQPSYMVKGVVRFADGFPAAGIMVSVLKCGLRREQTLGQVRTDKKGLFEIPYQVSKFRKAEENGIGLVVKAFTEDHSPLIASPILFNASMIAKVDLTIPADVLQAPRLFDKIKQTLAPSLESLEVEELEEDKEHQDLTFLSGETGFERPVLARFVLAHRLVNQGIQAEFWFALLGGSVYQFDENQSLQEQLTTVMQKLLSLDAPAVRKMLIRSFNLKEIPEIFRVNSEEWTEKFLKRIASLSVRKDARPTFVKLALEDINIVDTSKLETFARLFNEHKTLTPELLETLEKEAVFNKDEIADLRTSFELKNLTQSDYSVVRMIKETFNIRQPDQIPLLARKSVDEWVKLVQAKHYSGEITLPFAANSIDSQTKPLEIEIFGGMLERQFREAFPTMAFTGGLERALRDGGAHGLHQPKILGRFLELHQSFELLKTPIDDFLKNGIHPEFRAIAKEKDFRDQLMAVQRVFKLAPTFEATNTLLADELHSAQKIYRLGQSEFVRRFEKQPGFSTETAKLAWSRAADTHAAVLTIIMDFKALESEGLPQVLRNNSEAISKDFPNWDNLFKTGDLCECEQCRSVLSPAAYFADLLMFLKDRKAKNTANTVKDILFSRRPDLGFLELNCSNALTTLPYIDVVCEVLENAVDVDGVNDLELTGFTAVPPDSTAAKAEITLAFKNALTHPVNDGKEKIELDTDFSLSQISTTDPNRWVVHGDKVTYLLMKKGTSNFFAKILRNTKGSTDELRAYPQYVNPKAYDKLSAAKYPLSLPFDLFAEEVRAAFQKTNLHRWDLMRTLRSTTTPYNPTNVEIAAEYFGISTNSSANFDEKRLILAADLTIAGQQSIWGEKEADWLDKVGNVKNFLQKTSLEYNEMLALLDLKFINPAGDITVHHLDPSCDTEKKQIQVLDELKLDRIHRFLRLWRKLKNWKMWEIDLVIRHPRIGNGVLDESFLINLFFFSQLKNRLGGKTTVEQVCALFGDLNTETRFTKLHEKREDALYQSLFLNKRLISPLDPVFQLDPGTGDLPTGETLAAHHPAILAALSVRESDLILFNEMTKADDTPYITGDLTLNNISFLWRHTWLSKLLKFKADEWKTILKIFQQDILYFANPEAAWGFMERIDRFRAAGFTPDELSWLLAADRSAKAATKETDTVRFLTALRKDLQVIKAEFNPEKYEILATTPPTDVDGIGTLLISLLQKLNRDETAAQLFIATLRDEVTQKKVVLGLPVGFDFPSTIKNAIRIRYDKVTKSLHFIGLMTDAERTTLLTDALLSSVTGIVAYQEAIEEFFSSPRLELKFFEPVFTASLVNLPPMVDFKSLPNSALALKISYDTEQHLLRFAGILSSDEKMALDALSADIAYRNAVDSLFTQPKTGTFLPEKIWLLDADLMFPLRDPNISTNDHLAINLVTAVTKALAYLSKTQSENAVVQQSSVQLGMTEALTRHLLTQYSLLPGTMMAHLTGAFVVTHDAIDYITFKTTFDGWFWANRTASILNKWKITLTEFKKITALTIGAQLLDVSTLPLDDSGAIASIDRFLRTNRLLRMRDTLPETEITFLEVLEKLNKHEYAAADVDGLPAAFVFPAVITAAPNYIPISYDEPKKVLRFTGPMSSAQRSILLTDASLIPIKDIISYQDAIKKLWSGFVTDVQGLNEAWFAADLEVFTTSLDLNYPTDYLLAENWERLRRAFYFLDNLNASAGTARTFAAAAMTNSHANTIKELLRSKFGSETWLTLSAEIQDVLRERKRDALAAYLLTQTEPADAPSVKWENTNDLYAYYLLDVEMSSCQLTSRLVQGSGSIQLFVQRCFMGLEPDVEVKADGDKGDSAWRWWQWMRKYQVWVANRKVFLWPENWIEPELKKDRSSFFKDLENELLQNDINQYTVEAAFSHYLEKLDGVAQLEIAGFYHEDDGANAIVHVFGRTSGAEPHLYYYRRYDYRQWTPWERVDLDIQGDYLIPAVVNKRLFLFWPIFTEVPDEAGNITSITVPAVGGQITPTKTKKFLKLQMAVSDYRLGTWTPKRISNDFAKSDSYDVDIARKHYVFVPVDRSEIDGKFGIQYDGHSLGSDGEPQATLSGAFEISGCKGAPALSYGLYGLYLATIRPEQASTGIDPSFAKWMEFGMLDEFGRSENRKDGANDFQLENVNPYVKPRSTRFPQVLVQTPGFFKMTPPWHPSYFDRLLIKSFLGGALVNSWGGLQWYNPPGEDGSFALTPTGSWLPFFYNDQKRSFFVLPVVKDIFVKDIKGYYPELKWYIRYYEDAVEGYARTEVNKILLPVPGSSTRAQWEYTISRFSGEEASPPYTDEQMKNQLKKGIMSAFLYQLGMNLLDLFQSNSQFHFKNNYHPFVCEFAKLVYNPLKGIPALMSRETQLMDSGFSFEQVYQPTDVVVKSPPQYALLPDCYPREVVDFSPDGAYSSYNWELFFHTPMLIANMLSKNQRFEEAREWYHFIFNPLGVESANPGSQSMSKYWITKPFFETTDPQYVQQRIDNILRILAGDTTAPGYSTQAKQDLENQVLDWRTNPFEPHRIANYRTVAYQKTVVMKYLDNLIAWGDNLFRQDSMESINEATQLYIMAAEILGPPPKKVPPQAKPSLESFNELEVQFDKFSNVLVEVENLVPLLPGNGPDGADQAPLPMLYFCIPQNDKMLGYWGTVADRLYKIRHCMNIEGVVRQLALFEPPIDPGALVKAVAGGVDISSALADLNAPLPLYRFNVLLQKANEVCNDVKALGGALLGALEKKDSEAMGLLRQAQEIRLLEAVKTVREKQIEEAKENLEGIKRSKITIETRWIYYRDIVKINAGEQLSLDKQEVAFKHQKKGQEYNITASVLGYIPNISIGISGFGGSPQVNAQWGIGNIISALQACAGSETQLSNAASFDASRASTLAGYDRRFEDWKLQENLAKKELEQIDKQIASAELRITIAEKELDNQLIQIENAKATDEFMHSKYTNQELYQWQVGQISGVYFQSYRFAYDLAKRAERCFRFELGLQDSSYINFGYWDSLKKGLLAGEKLQYDLRRLETAYLEQNRREFELTKHVSLALLDPLALIKLRETGRCFFNLPEESFDLDYPGHYFRRTKSVSITLPCVVGPYITISCTLRLLKNSIRINTANGDNGYPRNIDDEGLPSDDSRFIESNIPVKAIASSNAQNDSGVFELNFKDERYLPFEGAGVVSQWSLELFSDLPSNNPDSDFGNPLRQFDYDTVSDAILHIKYTAREDAGPFKNGAITHLRTYMYQDGARPSLRMFNLRQEFPTQWHRFLKPTNPDEGNVFELKMSSSLFRILDKDKTLKINTILLLARCMDGEPYNIDMTLPLPVGSNTITLAKIQKLGGLHANGEKGKDVSEPGILIVPTDPPAVWQLKMTRPGGGNLQENPVTKEMEVEDVFLVVGYEWE